MSNFVTTRENKMRGGNGGRDAKKTTFKQTKVEVILKITLNFMGEMVLLSNTRKTIIDSCFNELLGLNL